MKKSSDFENILNDCLERLAKGETLEQCLESHPEQATQLKPLLLTAQAARKAAAILPRTEFKARARYEFHSALLQKASTKRRAPSLSWWPRWAVALMVASILLIAGGGTAIAATNSMPDSPLYPVKLATEQLQLALTPSDMGKARVCTMLADRRVAEIIYMAGKGDIQWVEVVTQRLDERLATLAVLVSAPEAGGTPEVFTEEPAMAPLAPPEESAVPPSGPPGMVTAPGPAEEARNGKDASVGNNNRAKLRTVVAGYAANHPDALRAVLRKAPESAKPALRRAIAVSVGGYKRALAALDQP